MALEYGYRNREIHDPQDVIVECIDMGKPLTIEDTQCVDCQTDPCSCPYCMVCGLDWDDCQDWIRPPK